MKTFAFHMKEILRKYIPKPILAGMRNVRLRVTYRNFPYRVFESWWETFRLNSSLPAQLVEMIDYFITTEDYRKLTKYWHSLNRKNIEQLAANGLDNFRQTVARNYFTWVSQSVSNTYTRKLVSAASAALLEAPLHEVFRKHEFFTLDESVQHNLITLLLYDHVRASGLSGLLEVLQESGMGAPPMIEIGGKRVSQDLLNSLIEFNSITSGLNLKDSPTIIEIGAGSGRTAYCFLKLIPQAKYFVVDVPPALFISQHFVSAQFANLKIFNFRSFSTYEEIAKELESAQLVFLMPHQLALLKMPPVDLFLAIDCLHEMSRDRVDFYFNQADRMARHIYFKCWTDNYILFDGVTWSFEKYPIRPSWTLMWKKQCFVPADFFEAFFRIRD